MELSERIKAIRKKTGLLQPEFAERIGVKGPTITSYETGARVPSDTVILAICREFHVNENWLRTGEGEMMAEVDADQELQDIFAEITLSNDDLIRRILKKYWQLPEKEKEIIRKLVDGFMEKNTPEK